jgi:DnaJ-class molecular chaperone
MSESYYKILNLQENATMDEIKKNYRKLSLEFHPDRPTGNAEKFKQINEAYEVLSNPQSRQQYDTTVLHPQPHGIDPFFDIIFNGMNLNGMHGFHGMNGININGINISHLFKPHPIELNLNLDFEQSYNGCSMPFNINRNVGPNHVEHETIYVDIPQGIDNDEIIQIPNKGNRSPDGKMLGDIHLRIKLEKNFKNFTRQGLDILYTHTISLKEALCGFDIDFEYMNQQKFKIHNHDNIISPNYKKVIPNLGFTRGDKKGNLIITFNIIFPTQLTSEQKSALSCL